MWAQMKKSTLAGCNGRGADSASDFAQIHYERISILGMCSDLCTVFNFIKTVQYKIANQ